LKLSKIGEFGSFCAGLLLGLADRIEDCEVRRLFGPVGLLVATEGCALFLVCGAIGDGLLEGESGDGPKAESSVVKSTTPSPLLALLSLRGAVGISPWVWALISRAGGSNRVGGR
jgi:hypothetical protein